MAAPVTAVRFIKEGLCLAGLLGSNPIQARYDLLNEARQFGADYRFLLKSALVQMGSTCTCGKCTCGGKQPTASPEMDIPETEPFSPADHGITPGALKDWIDKASKDTKESNWMVPGKLGLRLGIHHNARAASKMVNTALQKMGWQYMSPEEEEASIWVPAKEIGPLCKPILATSAGKTKQATLSWYFPAVEWAWNRGLRDCIVSDKV